MELIIGPMFSGKTTELLRRAFRYERMGMKILYLKYKGDVRYSTQITSHDAKKKDCLLVLDIADIMHLLKDYNVVVIDEAQFIKGLDILDTLDCKVILAGLDSDFRREPFYTITNLVAKCTQITKLSAICKCGNEAYFTKLKKNDDVEGNELIGGSELYEASCKKCFN